MTFSRLTSYWFEIEKTPSRLEMTRFLALLLKEAGPEEAKSVCYLSQGRLGPLFDPLEFNLADKMMLRVIGLAFGATVDEVRQEYKKMGDLGDVGEKLKLKDKKAKTQIINEKITVGQIYTKLREIAEEEGAGSVERKIGKMAALLKEADPASVKYLVRIPLGKMRLGFSDLTVLDALSWMVAGDKSKREEIETAYNLMADAGLIAERIKRKGIKELKRIGVELGVPVMPALCQRLPNAVKMVEKMIGGESDLVAVEPKYDGTRLQIHFSREKKGEDRKTQLGFDLGGNRFLRIFTRNLENVTAMFPDIARAVFEETKAQEAIFDGEAIGTDPKTGNFLPFQETIQRKRKHGVAAKAKEVPLKFLVFDLLYLDGKSWLERPFAERRRRLEEIVVGGSKIVALSPQLLTDKPEKIKKYHLEQKKKGLEGVVVKKWRAPYDPGRRGYTWVKLKSDEGKKGAGLADTVDAVVMGYYRGKGKRAGFGVGAFLVGIADCEKRTANSDRKYLTISKIGTGLTDEQWRELRVRCAKFEVRIKPEEYEVNKNLEPDVWLKPGVVVEIQADNITKSPMHSAGLALRFPRLVRFRDDKGPVQATSLAELKKLYQIQK